MKPKAFTLLSVCLVGGLLIMSSCSDSPSSTKKKTPPKLPPLNSISLNFSIFHSPAQVATGSNSSALTRYFSSVKAQSESSVSEFPQFSHFTHALDASISMRFALSDFIFTKRYLEAAKKADPKLNDQGKWEWNYQVFSIFSTFDVRLLASQKPNGSVTWKLYKKMEPRFLTPVTPSYHLYLSGRVNSDRQSGKWVYYSLFNFNPNRNHGNKQGRILWKILDKHHRKFDMTVLTNPYSIFSLPDSLKNDLPDSLQVIFNPDSLGIFNHLFLPHKGDHLTYNVKGSVVVAKYQSTADDDNQPIIIQWNKKTHSGYIKDPGYNGGNRACWDSNLMNIPCSVLFPKPMPN